MVKTSNNEKEPFKRVLITRFSALGDVAMTIPVVYSVCLANPNTQFYMLTQKVAASLFINTPKNLIVRGIKTSDYKGVLGLRKLYKEIKEEFNPDAFVDLHGVLRTHILASFFVMSGVTVRQIDKGRAGKKELTRSYDKKLVPLISSRARYREVFSRIGFKNCDIFDSLFHGKNADPELFSEITPPKKENEKWVAIAPFAKHEGKIYPLEKMGNVIAKISSRDNIKIFLLGSGEEEKGVLSKWASRFPNTISVAEKHYGFKKELALLSHCDAMISMDSANMHLASLVNLPVVSIWGATHPYCGFMGWKQEEENSVQLNMACRPCSVFGNKPCSEGDYFCLKGINPELVITKLDKVLNKKKNE